MTRLAPDLFDRRYDDLVELGRAQLPALAPEWTDHNAHDPGITLLELLAWVTEAQLYSVAHTRRDERRAYATLMGIVPHGTRPGRGLLWRDHEDPGSPAAQFAGARVIDTDARIRLEGLDEPEFRPEHRTLWSPGRVVALRTRQADGVERDLTASNDRGRDFLPLGERAGPRDVLELEFETRGDDGLFPARRAEAEGALWILGVRAAVRDAVAVAGGPTATGAGELSVSLVTQGERIPLPVVADSSAGMLRTGFLALDVSRVAGSPRRVRLAIRAPRGLARPPRLLRIEPNVLPVVQYARIERELHVANGLPDFSFELERAGVCFDAGEEPLRLEVRTETDFGEWRRCERLSEQGPNDAVYVLDVAQGRVLFGNGVNGRKPARGAEAYVSYAVSDGDAGNVAARRRWTVAGFAGVFGTNPDAVAGGTPRSDGVALRRRARLQARQLHTLVSAADMEAAARDLPLLEVARAWVATPRGRETQLGTVRLVAMRRRGEDARPGPPPETPRWLEAVRRSLAARMPLGTRLAVEGPRYVDFSVDLAFEVETGRDPAVVARDVETTLRRRLALVPTRGAPEVRPVGLAVSRADTAAWVLGVDGVARVTRLELRRERTPRPVIRVGRDALPRLDPSRSVIDAHRAGAGNTT